MQKRIYTGVNISSHIQCTSSRHYFAIVQPLGETGVYTERTYLINSQVIIDGDNQTDRPKYLIEMIKQALRAQSAMLRLFEVDRDGNRRYESLRYGSMADLLAYIMRE